jgi:hypothetical protein
MKRKIAIVGLAMASFVPLRVYANSLSESDFSSSYSSAVFAYVPHYGTQGRHYPLMDHLSVPGGSLQHNGSDTWRLEFAPPAAVSQSSDDPLMAKDKRIGVTFKLDF